MAAMIEVKKAPKHENFVTAQPKMLCRDAHSLYAAAAQVAHRVSTRLSTGLALESATASHRSVSFAVVAINLERTL
jgi:hypothetical protein